MTHMYVDKLKNSKKFVVFLAIVIFVSSWFGSISLHELIQASICTSENKSNLIFMLNWRFEASCAGGPSDEFLFDISGVSLVSLLAIEFFVLSYLEKWRASIIASLSILSYHIAVTVIEGRFYYLYMDSVLTYIICFSVTVLIFYLLAKKFTKNYEEKEHNWLPISLIIVLTSSFIATIVMYNLYYKPGQTPDLFDMPNWFTVNLEITFGIIIALFVYDKTKKSEKFVQATLKKIENLIDFDYKKTIEQAKYYSRIEEKILSHIMRHCKYGIESLEEWSPTLDDANKNRLLKIIEINVSSILMLSKNLSEPNVEISVFDANTIGKIKLLQTVCSISPPIDQYSQSHIREYFDKITTDSKDLSSIMKQIQLDWK